MSYLSRKTPLIPEGLVREVATRLLQQIHQERGLVRYLETKAGINGMRIKDDQPPLDLQVSQIIRILLHKAKWQTLVCSDFMEDWTELGKTIIKLSSRL